MHFIIKLLQDKRKYRKRREISADVSARPFSVTHDQLLLKLKEVNEANQSFCELKQCQKNNWIQKMDRVKRPLINYVFCVNFE